MSTLRPGTPEEAGMSAARIENLRRLGASWVEDGTHPALVLLVARRGVIVLHEAWGKQGPKPDAPALRQDAIFPLASGTKPITSTLALLLVEDGLLGLNRPVQEYLPEFQGEGKQDVLVHHLLTHTSGLANPRQGDDARSLLLVNGGALAYPEYLGWLHSLPLSSSPGETMSYSNVNLSLLGEIVSRVSGKPLEDMAQERLFEPLGMRDSSYVLSDAGYERLVRRPEKGFAAALNSRRLHEVPDGGFGVCATAIDVAAFMQMFLNGGSYGEHRSLSRATVREMTRNQISGISANHLGEFHREASWGYGWGVKGNEKWVYYGGDLNSPETFSHGGGGGIFYWVDPVSELVGVYFSVVLSLVHTGLHRYYADLFVNAATAAIED